MMQSHADWPRTRVRARCRSLLAGLLLALVGSPFAQATTDTAPATAATVGESLALAGGSQMLWIVTGEWDSQNKRLLNWIARIDPATLRLSPIRMQPLLDQVVCSSEWNGSLYLFVSTVRSGRAEASHYSYGPGGDTRRERRLPDDAAPLALAGGSKAFPGLWAVVDAATAQAVSERWEDYQRSLETQPTDDAAAAERPPASERPSVVSRPATSSSDGTALVVYDGNHWQPGFRAPMGVPPAARVWLTISDDAGHLFWQANSTDTTVRYAQRDQDAWMEMPPLKFDRPVAGGCASLLGRQLVFAALVETADGQALRCEPRVFMPAKNAWSDQPAVADAEGQPLTLPRGTRVAGFRDMLALLRQGPSDLEVGLWGAAGGQQVLAFTPVPIHKTQEAAARVNQYRQMLGMVVAGAIVLSAYWWRRNQLNQPIAFPRGVAVADLGRRGVAMLLDMLPASALVGMIWHAELSEYVDVLMAGQPGDNTVPPVDRLFWAWLCFAGTYATYCASFELLRGVTPGKRLLGCTILTESLEPPTKLQILIRNFARLIEFFPLLEFWPFLLLALMTLHRQRLGDLLAQTIVTERQSVADSDDDSDEG